MKMQMSCPHMVLTSNMQPTRRQFEYNLSRLLSVWSLLSFLPFRDCVLFILDLTDGIRSRPLKLSFPFS